MTPKTIALNPANGAERYRREVERRLIASRNVQEIDVPPAAVISAGGADPPGSDQFRAAISALYSVAYTLKMGLKVNKLMRPNGYFDYSVGALHALWWSTVGGSFQNADPATLRWKLFLGVPDFITPALVAEAARQANERHPEIDTRTVELTVEAEGRCVQVLHVGPYDQEQPALDKLHQYVSEHGLAIGGAHHEIYISDPNRTAPERLRTIIRYPVKPAK